MIKISTEYESFDDQKVENIVKELIRTNVIFSVGLSRDLYNKIQIIATRLGYMNMSDSMYMLNLKVLSDEDYLKISDKIWEYIISGILAPGRNYNNPWFPNLHLTEKGKEQFGE